MMVLLVLLEHKGHKGLQVLRVLPGLKAQNPLRLSIILQLLIVNSILMA